MKGRNYDIFNIDWPRGAYGSLEPQFDRGYNQALYDCLEAYNKGLKEYKKSLSDKKKSKIDNLLPQKGE